MYNHLHTCIIPVPGDARSTSSIREAAMDLKLGCSNVGGYPGGYNFEISYTDPADLIRLGSMYQSNLSKF